MNGLQQNQTMVYSSRYTRFVCPRTMQVSQYRFGLSTPATGDDQVDVGVYDAAGNRLTSSGATSGKVNTTPSSIVSVSFAPVTLVQGTIYYMGFGYNTPVGTACTLACTAIPWYEGATFSQAFGNAYSYLPQSASVFPLPAVGSLAGGGNNFPIGALQ